MWWFLALSLHLWPAPDAMLYFTASCAYPLAEYGCHWDAGIVRGGRWYVWAGDR